MDCLKISLFSLLSPNLLLQSNPFQSIHLIRHCLYQISSPFLTLTWKAPLYQPFLQLQIGGLEETHSPSLRQGQVSTEQSTMSEDSMADESRLTLPPPLPILTSVMQPSKLSETPTREGDRRTFGRLIPPR